MPEPARGHSRASAFIILSIATAALTWGLIVFGAIVRVTDSGLGCGTDWPLCNGTIFPPLDNIAAWIEWLHRLFAMLIGICGILTLASARRRSRERGDAALKLTLLAAGLFVLQSALGAIVVVLELPPTFVTLHLSVAMLLLGALLAGAIAAWYVPPAMRDADGLAELAGLNAALALLIIVVGALVRGSGATLACAEWPLCDGGVLLPLAQGPLALINMLHRLSVVAMGASLLFLILHVRRHRTERLLRWLGYAAGAVYLLQIGVGAMFVISGAGPAWGALHVGLAAAVWAILIMMTTMESMRRGLLMAGSGL